jgi:hypothetical protein
MQINAKRQHHGGISGKSSPEGQVAIRDMISRGVNRAEERASITFGANIVDGTA